ncbi:hypothetical protein C2E23DRAFT_811477 [Lenzites betulinus]|nr:hypothetical protein C2E23DRAFT_811477 [Lenzites betulinus]
MAPPAAIGLWTSQEAKRCENKRCNRQHLTDQGPLRWMASSRPGVDGKYLCEDCAVYYNTKSMSRAASQVIPSKGQIHQGIAAGQRGESSIPVVAVGRAQSLAPYQGMPPPAIPARPAPSHRSAAQPVGAVPGLTRLNELADFLKPTKQRTYGYAAGVHDLYATVRTLLQRSAYQGGGALSHLVTVKASMVVQLEGRKTVTQISNIRNSIPNVPAHVGAAQLKALVAAALLPDFKEWSHNATLPYDECNLRTKTWIQIIPLLDQEDVDAILPFVMTDKGAGRNKQPVIKKNASIDMYLEMPPNAYHKVVRRKERFEDGFPLGSDSDDDNQAHQHSSGPARAHLGNAVRQLTQVVSKSAASHASVKHIEVDDTVDRELEMSPAKAIHQGQPSTLGASSATTQAQGPANMPLSASGQKMSLSVSRNKIRTALKAQSGPSMPAAISFLHTINVDFGVKVCPVVPFEQLIFEADGQPWSHGIVPVDITLIYNPTGRPMRGAFKQALYALSRPVIPGFQNAKVSIKQCFRAADEVIDIDRATESGPADKGLRTDAPVIILPSEKQIRLLGRDIICLQWASALMDLVYHFIRSTDGETGKKCPLQVPELRYVRVAQGVEALDLNHGHEAVARQAMDRKVFMIEEFIDPIQEGKWRKYINNNSARPLKSALTTAARQHIADFLVFCQHLQWLQTGGLAYISDFQGGDTLLSDPQIMTSPNLGDNALFGSGNLPEAFIAFETEHVCSAFCKFYNLTFELVKTEEQPEEEKEGEMEETAAGRRDKGKGRAVEESLFIRSN